MPEDLRFDFAQFDTQAANLYLMVDTAEVVDHAVGAVAHQVAGAVQTGARRERIRHEALGGQVGTLVITTGQRVAADIQFASATHRADLQIGVQHIGAHVADRSANGGDRSVHRTFDQQAAGIDGRFGRAVQVVDLTIPLLTQLLHQRRAQPLATEGQGAQRIQLATLHFRQQRLKYRRRQLQGADLVIGHFAPEQRQIIAQRRAGEYQLRAVEQRQPELPNRGVETEGGLLQDTVMRCQFQLVLHPQHVVGQRTMADFHAFWPASGAGGVDHVGEVVRVQVNLRRRDVSAVLPVDQQVQFQAAHLLAHRQLRQQRRLGQQQANAAVAQHVVQTLTRVRRVQRHIGAAGLEDRQQTDDHFQAALQRDSHQHVRAHAQFTQTVRQTIGLTIQRGVAQLLLAKDQRHGVRCGLHLRFDQVMNRGVGKGHCRVIPVMQQVLTLGGVQQRQFAQRGLGIADQRLQQVIEMPRQLRHHLIAELPAVVAQAHRQRGADIDHQRQRIVRLLLVDQPAEDQALRRGLLQCLGHRVVLEHQDRIEQRLTTPPGPALDVVERRVLVLAQGQVLLLHLRQPLGHGLFRARAAQHRQGVDKQPKLLLDPRQFGRATGHSGTEGYAGLAGVALQQQQPGGLHQGVEGDPLFAGEIAQALGLLRVQAMDLFAITVAANRRAERPGQTGRLFQPLQMASPEVPAGRAVLTLQPLDIVAVASAVRRHAVTAVALEHLAEHPRGAPTVHENVVAGVDQLMAALASAQYRQTQQRALFQHEATRALRHRPLLDPRALLRLPPYIEFDERHLDLAQHRLHGLPQVAEEYAAQHVMLIQQRLPGRAETRHVEALDLHPQLVDVVTRLLLVQGVEQHALLHRRQRVDVLYIASGHRQVVKLGLGQAHQREVRRGHPRHASSGAMLDQLAQFGGVLIRQSLDGRALEHLAAEAPAQVQLAAIHLAVDADRCGQRRGGVLAVARGFAGRREQRIAGIETAIELAEVVEDDAALGQLRQGRTHRLSAQVTQHAVANALVGNRPQLFLDRLDRPVQRRPRRQAHRVQVAEPADGAAQVDIVEQVFAAVTFQADHGIGTSGPAADDPRQRGQQQVVDLRAVGGGRVLQQFAGQRGIQVGAHRDCVLALLAAFGVIPRQAVAGAVQLRLPPAQFLFQGGIPGVAVEFFRPGLERTALGRQHHRLARRQRGIGLLQVFQQHPPGHPVHHQVMDHQQQALLALRQVHQHPAQQRAVAQVEAALGFVGQRVQVGSRFQFAHPQQVWAVERGETRLPARRLRHETQAQGVMLFDQRMQGELQVHGVQCAGRLEHHRLVPVLALGNVGVEEARLDRQQRQVAAQLLDHGGGGFLLDQLGHRGQLADGLFFEQLLGAELDALALGPGNDLQAEDRVAAQFEEVVGGADPLQLEHIGPDRGEFFLDLTHRRGVRLFDCPRLGQRALVQLAVGGQRQALQQQDLRGHQVFRQVGRQLLAQRFGLQGHAAGGGAVAHQLQTRFVTVLRQRKHHGFGDAVQAAQDMADLARLDAVAANFHLIVGTAQVFQPTRHMPCAVAGAVQALAIGVRHEALGGQRRLAQITLGQTGATQVQLARDPLGHRIQPGVQHPRPGARQRLADRNAAAAVNNGTHFVGEDAHRGFGRAVVVENPAAGFQRADLFDQVPATGFATEDQQLRRQHIRRLRRLQQALQMARHDLQHLDPVLGHIGGEAVRVEGMFMGQQVQRAARRQGAEQQGVTEVGGNGRNHRHAALAAQLQALQHALHVIAQGAVADHHALGLTGGTGGVDDVGRLARTDGDLRRAARVGGPQVDVPGQGRAVVEGRSVVSGGMDQQRGAAVPRQLLQALQRLAGIQRQVHRAQLEHGQQAGHPLDTAFLAQRHGHAGANALCSQVMRKLVGLRVQLRVAQNLLARTQGRLVLARQQTLLPERKEAIGADRRCRRCRQQRGGLGVRQQRVAGVRDEVFQHAAQRGDDPLDGRRLEQVGGVGEVTAQALRRIDEVVSQVEARIGGAEGVFVHAQAIDAALGIVALVRAEDLLVDLELEQRVVAQVTLGRQGIHQVLEGQFLVRLRTGHHLFHLLQQLGERLPLIDLHPQHLGVDEEANQPFQLAAGAAGVGRADADIGLAAVARQHHRQRGQGQHEHRHALAARHALELVGQRRRQVGAHHRATVAGLLRTVVVQRQRQHRLFVAQLLFPVLQLPLALPGLQPGALPDGVVGVLHGQGRQRRDDGADPRLIELDEFAHQQLARPAIGHHMVHAQGQHMFGGAEAEQFDPQQGAAEQVERRLHLGFDQRFQGGFRVLGDPGGNLHHLQGHRRLFKNFLMELTVHRDKAGAQGFMPLDQLLQGAGQCRCVQCTAQAHRHRHVVGAVVRLHLPEEQHALLRVRQRDALHVSAGHGNRQQAEALPGLAHLVENLPTLLQRQADETFGNALCGRLVHLRLLPFRSSFFRYRTSRLRSATDRCSRMPG